MFEEKGYRQDTQGKTKIMSWRKNSEKNIFLEIGALHLGERGIRTVAFPFL